jgi:SAM-dependent methyltransferase
VAGTDRSVDHPFPPFALATRVSALPPGPTAFEEYETWGSMTRGEITTLLPASWRFEGKRILDFGCGAGRTLRHFLPEARTAELWGVDIDADSIDWLRENLCPPLHAARVRPDPPTDFESASFDLIWSVSVFTHLTDSSARWLLELHRLLKPGGLLIATYMGRWNSTAIAHEPWEEDRIGMNVLSHDQSWDRGGPMVLMSDWWVDEHWGRAFDLLRRESYVHNQEWVAMRKRDVEISPDNLLAPSDDPREWVALRHNLSQLQRELELRATAAEAATAAVAHGYERSLSWRLTRPLRWARARARGRRPAADA